MNISKKSALFGAFLTVGLVASAVCFAQCGARRTIQAGGLSRSYVLFVPKSYSSDKPMPLVMALHHFTGSGRQMERMSRLDDVAEREGFIVVYPDGRGRRWSAGFEDAKFFLRDNVDDVAFLSTLLDTIESQYSIDTKRVYVTGGSNGSMMTYLLALRMPDRIAAIAPIYGTMPAKFKDLPKPSCAMPVLIMHGTDDPILPWNGGAVGPGKHIVMLSAEDTAAYWADANGCSASPEVAQEPNTDPNDGTTVERRTYGGCKDGAEVLLYAVKGGGHTWPGSANRLSRFVMGRTSKDISASETVWAFFKRHARQ